MTHRHLVFHGIVRRASLAAALALTLVPTLAARAETLPPNFQLVDIAPGSGLVEPVDFVFAPDGRIWVAEKRGRIQILEPNGANPPLYTKRATPFLSIDNEVVNHQDRGLLGLVLDPDFATNGRVYIAYNVETDPGTPDIYQWHYLRIVRYTRSAGNPYVADAASRTVLLGNTWPEGVTAAHLSHSTGTLLFGDDGTLLFSCGDGAHYDGNADGGGRDAPQFLAGRSNPLEDIGAFRSQWMGSLSGKILRLDPNTGDGVPSNPWYQPGSPRSPQSRIWALGLRNPYRMSIKRGSGSTNPADGNPGTLFIADVGWFRWEEVNVSKGGENFGWPCYEGTAPEPEYQNMAPPPRGACPPDASGMTPPLLEWPHNGSESDSAPIPGLNGNAAVGAAFYQGTGYPIQYRNRLFFADYPNQWMYTAVLDENDQVVDVQSFGGGLGQPVNLRIDPLTGDVVYSALGWGGLLIRIQYTGPSGSGVDPTQPTGTVALPEPARARLAWNYNAEADLIGYNVYRTDPFGGPEVLLTPQPIIANQFVDDGSVAALANGLHYSYSVEAVDNEQPPRISPRSALVEAIPSSKAWEWYAPLPGPSATVPEAPAHFPRDIVVPAALSVPFDHWNTIDRAPQLRRVAPAGDWILETRATLQSYTANKLFHSGLSVAFGPNDLFYWGFYKGTSLRLERSGFGNLMNVTSAAATMSLRIVKTGSTYSFQYRANDAAAWQVGGTQSVAATPLHVGFITKTWEANAPTTVRLDRLAVNELPPVAQASGSVASGSAPLSVQFTDASYDPDGDVLTHRWDFGDGQGGTAASPAHIYGGPGNYVATLTVQDGSGLRASQNFPIQVQGNFAPTAIIGAPTDGGEYTDPQAPLALSGTGADVEDSPAQLTYDWSVHLHQGGSIFPDWLDPASQPSTSLVPGTSGGANVWLEIILTVTDTQGSAGRDTVQVWDHSLPAAAIVDLRAALADGSAPPAVPGAASPWADLIGTHDAQLAGVTAPNASSGWNGSGTVASAFRLAFDGIDDHATIPAASIPGLQNPAAASVELWLHTSSDVQSRQYILEWLAEHAAPFSGMSLVLQNGELQTWNGSWQSLGSVAPDRWVHVALVKSAGSLRGYIDGRAVLANTLPNLGGQVSEVTLGCGTYGGAGVYSDFFAGALGEVRLYDIALTPGNVAVAHATGAPQHANPPLVSGIVPATASNEANLVGASITGAALGSGADVRLVRVGEVDIVATNVAAAGDSLLSCDLPIGGAIAGAWDVVVTNSIGLTGSLPAGFTITPPPLVVLDLDAALANGSSPPTVPGAASPWASLMGGHLASLAGFGAPGAGSGWQGAGVLGDPYRLRFDGVDDRVTLPAASIATLQSPADVSVDLWFAPGNDVTTRQYLLDWVQTWASPFPGCALIVDGGMLRVRGATGWTALAMVTPGTFTHVALCYDAAGMRAYVDGTLRASAAVANLGSQTSELVLGASTSGGPGVYGEYFEGDLGRVRVHRVALDAPAVAALHASGQATFGPPPPMPQISLTPNWGWLAGGTQFVVDVRYDDFGGGGPIRGFSIEVGYDPTRFAVVGVTEGPFLEAASGANSFFAANTATAGSVRIDQSLLGSTAGAAGAGVLAQLTFVVQPGAAEGPAALGLNLLGLIDVANPPQQLAAQVSGATRSIDRTPPATPTEFAVVPATGGVRVSVTPPGADFAGLTLFTRPWSAAAGLGYPEYDDLSPAPAWPTTVAEARTPANGWTETTLDASAVAPHTIASPQRTVLSVLVCSRDAAGNLSDIASAPRGRATTYRLGDLGELDGLGQPVDVFDGKVDGIRDLPVLSLTYGAVEGGAGYLPGADIGPTDNGSGTGLPLTDNAIDFSDLVIFAVNFGLPAAKDGGATLAMLADAPTGGPLRVALGQPQVEFAQEGQPRGRVDVPLQLFGNPGTLKALRVALRYDPEQVRYLGFTRADVLDLASAPVFVSDAASYRGHPAGAPQPDVVALDLAVLGQGALLGGDGTFATLHLELLGQLGGAVQPVAVEARGVDGTELAIDSQQLARASVVPAPARFQLLGAAPNPFNPRTTLRFELPEPAFVKLRVFDVAGRLVRELVERELPAGYHAFDWDGTDDRGGAVASGVYLYELGARDFREVRKMLLVK